MWQIGSITLATDDYTYTTANAWLREHPECIPIHVSFYGRTETRTRPRTWLRISTVDYYYQKYVTVTYTYEKQPTKEFAVGLGE